ncbi:MAG: hypothetical protein QM802_09290 [Agriterribacter sp.]
MKFFFLLLIFFFSAEQLSAQKIIEQYYPQSGSLQIGLGKNDFIPLNEKGYTLVLPDTLHNIKGVLISFEDSKFNIQGDTTQQIYREATAKNFAVLYISTGIPVDLFFSTTSLLYVDSVLKNVFTKYNLPNKNIFFLGVNLAGHRALRYIEFYKQGKSIFTPGVKGLVLCEGVLDWVRFWYECKKGIRDHVSDGSVFEGKLITYLLEKNLAATPKNNIEKYLDFSPYSYFDEKNRHLSYYKDYAIRTYTEPATDYWLNVKGKTTFDTNFPDMVGIINEVKLAGNKKSALVIFNQDRKNTDKRNPDYTWGLVDKKELMTWIDTQAE